MIGGIVKVREELGSGVLMGSPARAQERHWSGTPGDGSASRRPSGPNSSSWPPPGSASREGSELGVPQGPSRGPAPSVRNRCAAPRQALGEPRRNVRAGRADVCPRHADRAVRPQANSTVGLLGQRGAAASRGGIVEISRSNAPADCTSPGTSSSGMRRGRAHPRTRSRARRSRCSRRTSCLRIPMSRRAYDVSCAS